MEVVNYCCGAAWDWFCQLGPAQLSVLFFGGLLASGYATYLLAGFAADHPDSKLSQALLEMCDCELPDKES